VQQILLNLLSNAVKFTARGDVSLAVDARRADDGGYEVEFKVTDEGIGIPAEKMGRLFGTFSQVDASTTRQYGGTGLGLAISKALVTLLGGKIGVDSEEGRGSTFSFTIRAGELADGRPSNVGDPPPSDVRAKRVLLLTGNGRVRDMVVRALTSGGAVVTAVASLSAKTAMGSWDAGIVDLGAGREGDVRVAESFRKLYPEIPVVLLMPLGRHDARLVEFVKAHGMATVAKPIKPARLLHALARGGEHESLSLRAGPATGGEPHGAATTPRRVLVVDDSNINQKVHRRLLEELGHSVDVVDDGLEAIQAVGRRGYDVVFLDLQMPGLDGFETARRLVARWPAPQRPRLIALTANVGVEDRDACIAAGMDGYLSKPVRLSDVQAAMRDVPVNPRSASTAGGGVSSSIDEGIIDSSAVQGLGALESHSGEPFLSPLIDQFFGEAPKRLADLEGALARGDARATA
jgi:CheY-like chemotaxis protein